MRRELIELLKGRNGEALAAESFEEIDGHIMEGVLREPNGYWYPIIRGVPCLLRGGARVANEGFREKYGLPAVPDEPSSEANEAQRATTVTFSDKWQRFKNYGMEPKHQEFLMEWYCRKLDLPNIDELKKFYASKELILEVGPGSGFNSRFIAENCGGSLVSLDISEAAFTTWENTSDLTNCHAVQADLMDVPFDNESFDFIIADGVLHHTPDTFAAVRSLYRKLRPNGQFYFYVYRRMGAVRRFCDEYIRSHFTQLEPEKCYEACQGLTELGRELAKLDVNVTLDKGVPILGIPPGTHNVQRLIYYNFVKCFWNDAFDYETNNMVNYDWYHPHNAWQHSEDEVEGWLKDLGVGEYQFNDSNPNGISVLLRKPAG